MNINYEVPDPVHHRKAKAGDRVLIFNRNPHKAWRSGIVLAVDAHSGFVTVEHKGGAIRQYLPGAVRLPGSPS